MLNLLWHYSYAGIFVGLVLCGVGLPVPEEVPIVFAGIASSNGGMNPYFAYFACLLGAIGGDCLMYSIGYFFGKSVLREHPRLAGFLTPEREIQLEEMIKRHGIKALFLCRFMIGIRSAVYLTAGILRVPFLFFLVVDGFCATIVVSFVFGLSYAFGDRVLSLIHKSETILTVLGIAALTVAVCFYYYQKKKAAVLPQDGKALPPSSSGTESEAGREEGVVRTSLSEWKAGWNDASVQNASSHELSEEPAAAGGDADESNSLLPKEVGNGRAKPAEVHTLNGKYAPSTPSSLEDIPPKLPASPSGKS